MNKCRKLAKGSKQCYENLQQVWQISRTSKRKQNSMFLVATKFGLIQITYHVNGATKTRLLQKHTKSTISL